MTHFIQTAIRHIALSATILSAAGCGVQARQPAPSTDTLPHVISSGLQDRFHVQGAVADLKRGCVYFSFTTKLIKTDLQGNLIGSVDGLTGHLGDLALHPGTGRLYGSLEYKDDDIGRGIRKGVGQDGSDMPQTSAFYIAVFNPDRITRPGMDAERDSVMTAVCLPAVSADYHACVSRPGRPDVAHRYGCSGIDGVTFAPGRDKKDGMQPLLYVAYGIYADSTRTDNDYQVLQAYDVSRWERMYERPLSQAHPHSSGPACPEHCYFVSTGNTTYGLQNLAYDPGSGNFYAAAYKGIKNGFPNYTLFVIDGNAAPRKEKLRGVYPEEEGLTLPLLGPAADSSGTCHDIRGWHFPWGATGLSPIGDGRFYISHNGVDSITGRQFCNLKLYKWTGKAEKAFSEEK